MRLHVSLALSCIGLFGCKSGSTSTATPYAAGSDSGAFDTGTLGTNEGTGGLPDSATSPSLDSAAGPSTDSEASELLDSATSPSADSAASEQPDSATVPS